jgi:Xaa-Pro aminopeptidase
MYCADVSRTFPVSGCFSPPQRVLYETVLRAQRAAIAAVRPGAPADALHRAAVTELINGLRELRLIDADLDQALEDESVYRRFYPHKTSHWLGLETHDVGAYADQAGPRALQPGMILTIEPALYIPIDTERAPAELRGTGIRIEDDVLVTEQGNEVLTAAFPTRLEEVEALLRER